MGRRCLGGEGEGEGGEGGLFWASAPAFLPQQPIVALAGCVPAFAESRVIARTQSTGGSWYVASSHLFSNPLLLPLFSHTNLRALNHHQRPLSTTKIRNSKYSAYQSPSPITNTSPSLARTQRRFHPKFPNFWATESRSIARNRQLRKTSGNASRRSSRRRDPSLLFLLIYYLGPSSDLPAP